MPSGMRVVPRGTCASVGLDAKVSCRVARFVGGVGCTKLFARGALKGFLCK